ncbi:Serine/threonine-protein phosphatase 7 long form [Glycine max]|nr:Serine/threonine-protein phosphatase 7 long form [Glycine max]
MLTLPAEPTPLQLAAHCRGCILGLIGGVLMLDKSWNRVHLMYLPLLADLDRDGRYNWGSTCLAYLYREMYRVIYPTSKKWKDYNSWAWYHIPFIQPRVKHQPSYPLANRWSDRGLRFFGILSGDVIGYRSRFDNMHNKEVESFVFCFMVMLQFGLCQDIPNPSHNLDQVYYIDMSGHSGTNWAEKYQ